MSAGSSNPTKTPGKLFFMLDYTQFDEWSSDEEVTIYTGIEKGYERWLQHPHENPR